MARLVCHKNNRPCDYRQSRLGSRLVPVEVRAVLTQGLGASVLWMAEPVILHPQDHNFPLFLLLHSMVSPWPEPKEPQTLHQQLAPFTRRGAKVEPLWKETEACRDWRLLIN